MTTQDSVARDAVSAIVGVYNADGGLRGEAAYVIGHLFGTRECALCDITHTWRRKPEWDALVRRVGVPVELRHLNELDEAQRNAVRRTGAPVVFAVVQGELVPVLDAETLAKADGSVAQFEDLLCEAVPGLVCTEPAARP